MTASLRHDDARAASYPFVVASDKVKEISQELARNLLTKERYNYVADWYNSLPSGTKIVASSMGEGIILYGGGAALSLATKPLLKSKLPLYKSIELEPEPSLAKFEHFALAESNINIIIDDIIGNEKIFSGSRRELAALEVKQILREEGKVMAGAGHPDPIKDINRLVAIYGGDKADWVKKKSSDIIKAPLFDKRYKKEIHWYENIKTGEQFEFKVKKQPHNPNKSK